MLDFLRRWFGPDRHTAHVGRSFSDRLLVRGVLAGVLGMGLAIAGIALLPSTDWREVLAGALLAWSVAIMVWSVESFRKRRERTKSQIRQMAEMDVLHARLNQIASKVGAPLLGLQAQIEHVTTFRERRVAHFAALDELAPDPHGGDEGSAFWNPETLGGET